jgi:hypothetical protein
MHIDRDVLHLNKNGTEKCGKRQTHSRLAYREAEDCDMIRSPATRCVVGVVEEVEEEEEEGVSRSCLLKTFGTNTPENQRIKIGSQPKSKRNADIGK